MKTNNDQRLERIRIVLVDTSHPGNIGSVARAMKTMCLKHLVLVTPAEFPHAHATARASGADDILAQAQVVDSLDDALKDCQLVIGASARLRRLEWPLLDPQQGARQALDDSRHGNVAIVFGREHAGLTNDELERCHFLLQIATDPEFSSLNLAAAVQVVCYEIFRQFLSADVAQPEINTQAAAPDTDKDDLRGDHYANAQQVQYFYEHLEAVLMNIGFLDPHHPRKMMRRLKRLFNRARLSVVELNILRGILSNVEKK